MSERQGASRRWDRSTGGERLAAHNRPDDALGDRLRLIDETLPKF